MAPVSHLVKKATTVITVPAGQGFSPVQEPVRILMPS